MPDVIAIELEFRIGQQAWIGFFYKRGKIFPFPVLQELGSQVREDISVREMESERNGVRSGKKEVSREIRATLYTTQLQQQRGE